MNTQPRLRIAADLSFSVRVSGHETVSGSLTGEGDRLEVRLSDPAYFAGGRDAAHLKAFAASLARHGVTVVVMAGDTVLLEMGDTHVPWWQRMITRSPHLRVASPRGAWTGAIGRVRGSASDAVLPGRDLVPPATLFPIAPTFGRTARPVTTTNDPRRGGNPRLVLAAGNTLVPADGRVIFPLRETTTTIGAAADADISLHALADCQAIVLHDEHDELVVFDRSDDRSTRLNGEHIPESGRVLRTGARLELGDWTLVYRRAEYADHGRPFGGRIGGELGHQKSQAPMPVGR